MARFARVVVPGVLHDVTERGSCRRQAIFGEGAAWARICDGASADLSPAWGAIAPKQIRKQARTGRPLGEARGAMECRAEHGNDDRRGLRTLDRAAQDGVSL